MTATNSTLVGCAVDQATSTLAAVLTNLKAIAIAMATRKMPWVSAVGHCPSDNNENGICDTEEFGCSDPEACNFVSADLMDDGSCEYPAQYYDCDGECINDENNNDICDELDLKGACRTSPATSTPTRPFRTRAAFTLETIATTTTLKRSTTR